MNGWKQNIKYNPIPTLLSVKNPSILYFVNRDLLEKKVEPVEKLWDLPEVEKIFKKQQEDGSWKYPSSQKNLRTQENYNQIETFRQLGELIEKYRIIF